MATKNLVPRANNEGNIGTDAKRWAGGNLQTLKVAGQNVVTASDARLTDNRTPSAHKASHAIGGSDRLTLADLGAAAAPAVSSALTNEIDWTLGTVFTRTLTANTNFVFTNIVAGKVIELQITGPGGFGYNLPIGIVWEGAAQTGLIGAGQVQKIVFTAAGTAVSSVTARSVGAQNTVNTATFATQTSVNGKLTAGNNLSDLQSVTIARNNLQLGSAAILDVGTNGGNVIALDGSKRLPAVDASYLTFLGSSYSFSTTTWQATNQIALSGSVFQTISLGGNSYFQSTSRAAGCSTSVRLINSSGADCTLSFPGGWTFLGSTAPTKILAGKTALLSLTCFGTTDADILAVYAVQP